MEAKKILDALERIDCSYVVADEYKLNLPIADLQDYVCNHLLDELLNELKRHIRVNSIHDDEKHSTKYRISLIYYNPDKAKENGLKTFVDTAVGKDVSSEAIYDTETNKIVDVKYK